MKKLAIIIMLIICLSFVHTNCGKNVNNDTTIKTETNDAKSKNDIYKDIEKSRTVYAGNDSLYLWPFELFSIMTFKNVSETGLYESLEFIMDKTNSTMAFIDALNKFTYNGNFNDTLWTGNKVIIKLKTIDGVLEREIIKGEKYKVIFAYISDSEVLRTNIGTEHASDYYIVDIIKINEKFQRQIPVSY